MWWLVSEDYKGKQILRAYLIIDGIAIRAGKSVPVEELREKSLFIKAEMDPFELLSRGYVVYFKKDGDAAATGFEVKKKALSGIMNSYGADVGTGEYSTLAEFLANNGFNASDVVKIVTGEETKVVRQIQRCRLK